jgi:hypothetical protein
MCGLLVIAPMVAARHDKVADQLWRDNYAASAHHLRYHGRIDWLLG